MVNEKWDRRFLDLSNHISGWSKDPSTKVGAVITNDNRQVISLGYNGFPRGVYDGILRYMDRDYKYLLISHAERNALDNAHTDVTGCTIYSPLFPCSECAKSIIQRGIKRVVSMMSDKEDKYGWETSFLMFKEAGVEVTFYG